MQMRELVQAESTSTVADLVSQIVSGMSSAKADGHHAFPSDHRTIMQIAFVIKM